MRRRCEMTTFALPSDKSRSQSQGKVQSKPIVSLFGFSERRAFAHKSSLESFRAIAVVAGPAFGPIPVTAAAPRMGVLDLEQIEKLFPIGAFFIERGIAVA